MWLPKNERKLLTIYYIAICEALKKTNSTPTDEKWYDISDLTRIFEHGNHKKEARKLEDERHRKKEGSEESEQEKSNFEKQKKKIKTFTTTKAIIDTTNAALESLELIKITPHQTERMRNGISLTIDGYYLGRKYTNPLISSGLWFREYKGHWLWLIIAYIAGILSPFLIDALRQFFENRR